MPYVAVPAYYPEQARWRNGSAPDGLRLRSLAQAYLHLLGHSRRVLLAQAQPASWRPVADTGGAVYWRTYGRLGRREAPAPVRSQVTCLPADGVYFAPLVRIASTALLNTPITRYITPRAASPSWPGDIIAADIRHDPDPTQVDQAYEFTLALDDGPQLLGWVLHEDVVGYLNLGQSDQLSVLDDRPILRGSHILDAWVEDLILAADHIWRRRQAHVFGWSMSGGTIVRTAATYANLFDQTYTSRTAASPGFPVPARAAPSQAGPVVSYGRLVCAAYCRQTGAGPPNARVDFRSSVATLSIEMNSTTLGWRTGALNVDPEVDEDKVDVLIAGQGAGIGNVEVGAVAAWLEPA